MRRSALFPNKIRKSRKQRRKTVENGFVLKRSNNFLQTIKLRTNVINLIIKEKKESNKK